MTGRILVVDAVPTNRIILRVKLSAAFYEVSQAASGRAALSMFRRSRPDMVIVAADLPDTTGRALIAKLRLAAGDPRLPVVLLHDDASADERLASLAAGADDVLSKPLDDLVMLARLRSLLRARDAEAELQLRDDTRRALGLAEQVSEFETPALIRLVPTGKMPVARSLQAELRHRMTDQIELTPPDEALRFKKVPPDVVVILEGDGAQGAGLSLLPQLRSNREMRHAALIYVAQPDQRQEAASALDMGANDLLGAGPDPEELALRLKKQISRKRTNDRLRANMQDGLRAAVCDPLTGLYNRRYALPHLNRLAERAETQGRDYALLLLDLDHFKSVNDTHGHAAGDAVLQAVSKRLIDNLRAADLVARFGGEEFLVAMPDATRERARMTAERLCRLMEQSPLALPNGETIKVTLSIGVAIGKAGQGDEPAALIEAADRALYAAKDKGRNTVVMGDTVHPLRPRAERPRALAPSIKETGRTANGR
ncbi:diguanylate cyclase [Tropicibacter oceani]|uniref:diguanylate cyclase n=1 Tax=Tropicibacter oceani TaxID=3058420 RepID=A0ABY8QNJ8_9RHOB|nr:diguanylate cyclase [Tropicibacter oceani]WGW05596.1 diguanylate cyclase [Tropicibacter oceani]